MDSLLSIGLWTSFAAICYSYVGYPLIIYCIARLIGKPSPDSFPTSPSVDDTNHASLPTVTVLIAAHNPGVQIDMRIRNLLACDYPLEKLQILVAADGCTDDTAELVRNFGLPQVNVLDYSQRRGKASTLVDAINHVNSEVILFTDASTRFDIATLRRLAAHFHDPSTGIVSGKVTMLDEQERPVESLYWQSEMMVRRAESSIGLMMGASGAIYAMRRRLFVAPNRPIINDDLVFPMLAYLRHRCQFILEPTAVAYATSYGGLRTEFCRRSRIGAGGYQSLPVLRELFRWKNSWQALGFISHKLLRWICPFLLIVMFVCNLGLLVSPAYQNLLCLQSIAYGLAVSGLFAPDRGRVSRIAKTASSFLVMNAALLTGFFQWLANANQVIWNPSPRPTPSSQL